MKKRYKTGMIHHTLKTCYKKTNPILNCLSFFLPLCLFLFSIAFLLAYLLYPLNAIAKTGIINTPHNLSATKIPGDTLQPQAVSETRICIFCHTPHNSFPQTPLWNKELKPENYVLYESTTLSVTPLQPDGPTKLCLSCHDGTIALGAVWAPTQILTSDGQTGPWTTTIETTGEIRERYIIGTDLRDDHPVTFPYPTTHPEIRSTPPLDLVLYGGGNVHCSTCHDPHDNTYGKFLAKDNKYSALCTSCHNKNGWDFSTHKSSTALTSAPLPRMEWTGWKTVAEYGCEGCHTMHSAQGKSRLLYYNFEEMNCYACHAGNVAVKDIYSQFQKTYRHPVEATAIEVTANYHDPMELLPVTNRHAECVDCHNPHASNDRAASPPNVSGKLEKVTGIDMYGAVKQTAQYEYEICYKCHADTAPFTPFINRVINETNTRFEFALNNPSYHPVMGAGRSDDVPSLNLNYSTSSIIYCMDCHEGNESSAIGGTGPRGPHGSDYPPILRDRYETGMQLSYFWDNFALCYRCHDESSIRSDNTFKKSPMTQKGGHSGHLDAGTSCSACHDAHGIKDDYLSGSHTRLINFDSSMVNAIAGEAFPLFNDLGYRSGSCTLLCHDKLHVNLTY